jgi:hypothetical protein
MTAHPTAAPRSHSKPVDLWFRTLCRLRWHTWVWRYSDDHSEKYRACRYCGRERPDVPFVPVAF